MVHLGVVHPGVIHFAMGHALVSGGRGLMGLGILCAHLVFGVSIMAGGRTMLGVRLRECRRSRESEQEE